LELHDSVAALKRRAYLILGLGLLTSGLALGASFLLKSKFVSRSLVQVAAQVLPAGYVKPIVTEHLADRIATLEQRVLTRARLTPVIERYGLARGEPIEGVLEEIRSNVAITTAEPGSSQSSSAPSKKKALDRDDIPSFYMGFTWDNAHEAQQVCSEPTSMLLDENVKLREQVGHNTTEFLGRHLYLSYRLDESTDLDSFSTGLSAAQPMPRDA
jgi:hypothetical protein